MASSVVTRPTTIQVPRRRDRTRCVVGPVDFAVDGAGLTGAGQPFAPPRRRRETVVPSAAVLVGDEFADHARSALGLEGHLALVIAHNDTDHAHWHLRESSEVVRRTQQAVRPTRSSTTPSRQRERAHERHGERTDVPLQRAAWEGHQPIQALVVAGRPGVREVERPVHDLSRA